MTARSNLLPDAYAMPDRRGDWRTTLRCVLLLAALAAARAADVDTGADTSSVRLSLRDFVARVVRDNKQVSSQRIEWDISSWGVKAEGGIFEPIFMVTWKYEEGERQNTAEQQSSQLLTNPTGIYVHHTSAHTAGLKGMLPLGTSYSIGYSLDRLENTINQFNNEYVSFAGLEFTQPLLKGFGSRITKAPIRLAQKEYEVKYQELRKRMIGIIAQAESTYWDLCLKHEQLAMRRASVLRAETLLTDTRERLAAGKVSTLDVSQAETGVLLRRAQQQGAEQQAAEAADTIRSLLSERASKTSPRLIPTEQPGFSAPVLDLKRSQGRALANHPDYLIALKQLEQEEIRLAVTKDGTKPQLDVVASYGLNGWGDTTNRNWDSLDRKEYEAWAVGVEFTVGLGGNRRARSELQAAKLRLLQQRTVISDLEVQLSNMLNTVFGKLDSLAMRLKTLDDVVSFNQRLLKVALQRLEEGKGDIRDVLQFEEDLVEAENHRLEALTEHRRACLELEGLEATVLEARSIEISRLYE